MPARRAIRALGWFFFALGLLLLFWDGLLRAVIDLGHVPPFNHTLGHEVFLRWFMGGLGSMVFSGSEFGFNLAECCLIASTVMAATGVKGRARWGLGLVFGVGLLLCVIPAAVALAATTEVVGSFAVFRSSIDVELVTEGRIRSLGQFGLIAATACHLFSRRDP